MSKATFYKVPVETAEKLIDPMLFTDEELYGEYSINNPTVQNATWQEIKDWFYMRQYVIIRENLIPPFKGFDI
jgi:hypothetical protein